MLLIHLIGMTMAITPPVPIQRSADLPAIIPVPVALRSFQGEFVISPRTRVVAGSAEAAEAEKLVSALAPALGFRLPIVSDPSADEANAIVLELNPSLPDAGDQGWRIEIRKYPRLTEVGAWRKETLVGHLGSEPQQYDGRPHGGYYTQDDIREIVRYAADRHINVLPEIEMPGHARAAISAYPELGCNPEQRLEPWTRWGVCPDIFVPTDQTVAFLQDVLTEVLELFPSKFIHIGGDEAIKDRWKASAVVQQRIRQLGLKDEHEMQSWFIRRMDAFLTERGRRLIGWDEILEGGLAPGAAVMSWRGEAGGIAAARAGHDVVMAPTTHTYLDYYQAPPEKEPLAIGGMLTLETVYAWEPVPKELTAEQRKHVLGGQGQLWAEYLPSARHVQYMAFPRAAALAEVLWSPPERRQYQDFLDRLRPHLRRLDVMDINHRRLDNEP